MKTNRMRLLAGLALGLLYPGAGRCGEAGLSLKAGSRLWLEGDSTLHVYSSTATRLELSGAAEAASAEDALAGLVRAGKVQSLALAVPVEGLKSGESGLDKNLRKALKAAEFPAIVFHLGSYQALPGASPQDPFPIKAKGRLEIAGQERDVELDAEARVDRDSLSVRGSKELLMTDFGVKPPKLMGGLLKTSNRVLVRYEILLEMKKAASDKRRVP